MAENKNTVEEIVFLESEIVEDDEFAPVGVLVKLGDAPVEDTAQPEEVSPVQNEETEAAEEAVKEDAVAVSEEQARDAFTEAVETESDDEAEEAQSAGETEPEQNAETQNQTETNTLVDEKSVAEAEAAVQTEEVAAYDTAEAKEPAITDEETSQINTADEVINTPAAEEDAAKAPAEKTVMSISELEAESSKITFADFGTETAPAKKKTEAKPKTEKPKKKSAAEENVWATAVIKPKKTEAAEKTEEETEVKPVKKPAAKKAAASESATETPKKTKAQKNKVQTEGSTVSKENTKTAKATEEKPKKAAAAKTAEKPAAKTTVKAEPKAETTAKPATKKADDGEKVIIAGDENNPHGKFVIKKTDKGNFVYKLYSYNHRVVAIGAEPYTSLATCKTGINSVMNNAAVAAIEDQTLKKWEEQKYPKWQIFADKKGEIRLRLCASNGNIVATTNDGYLSKEAAKKGIEAIARAAKGADVVRNDNLW